MGWHFPVVSGGTVSHVTKDLNWVLYTEPVCAALKEKLLEGDRLSRQKHGYAVGAARPTTPAEHQFYTWSVDNVQRFDDTGARLVKPKMGPRGSSRSPSPRRDARSPPRWMRSPSPP